MNNQTLYAAKDVTQSNTTVEINSSPSATYLVQTDPRFTNRNNWLSSD